MFVGRPLRKITLPPGRRTCPPRCLNRPSPLGGLASRRRGCILRRMQILISGAGVAGLATALTLARAGRPATLLEQDSLEQSERWPAAFGWPRNGIPHFHQPHAFIPRGRKVLREIAPDVYAALLAAGATEQEVWRKAPGAPRPEDEVLSTRAPGAN